MNFSLIYEGGETYNISIKFAFRLFILNFVFFMAENKKTVSKCEARNDNQFFKFQSHTYDLSSNFCDDVLPFGSA